MTLNKLTMIAATLTVAIAVDAATITGVSARQRWPWNNLVDVDFTISGNVGDVYAIDIKASVSGGEKILNAQTFATEPIATAGVKTRVVWDLGADYPGFHSDDFKVTVTATPFSDSTPLYCVIDISGGPTAAKWPVHYTTAAPVFSVGNADPCKTTELWLKRVKAGTNTRMGNSNTKSTRGSYYTHTCVLTNDYYLGIFPVTQSQFALMDEQSGRDLSEFTNMQYAATRPVDGVMFKTIREVTDWSTAGYDKTDAVADGCIIAYLRQRTGLKTIDLPTEWQWEFACRAGTTDNRYTGATYRSGSPSPDESSEIYADKGLWPEEYGTSYVDRYNPNPWGFYGMIGNVWEWCANYHNAYLTENEVITEPRGGYPVDINNTPAYQQYSHHAVRGGAWNVDTAKFTYNFSRAVRNTGADGSSNYNSAGFRLCIPVRDFYGAE